MVKVHIMFILIISSLMLIADARILGFFTKREITVKFRIYVHDYLSGNNATVYEVAEANITSTSPSSFGLVSVSDSLITAEPDPNSEVLGRAQGFLAHTDLAETAIVVDGVFLFTAGEYSGGAFSLVGRKVVSEINQEFSIVGGTGIFRMARGYTISNLHSYDAATNHYVWIYDTVIYIESGHGFLAKE